MQFEGESHHGTRGNLFVLQMSVMKRLSREAMGRNRMKEDDALYTGHHQLFRIIIPVLCCCTTELAERSREDQGLKSLFTLGLIQLSPGIWSEFVCDSFIIRDTGNNLSGTHVF